MVVRANLCKAFKTSRKYIFLQNHGNLDSISTLNNKTTVNSLLNTGALLSLPSLPFMWCEVSQALFIRSSYIELYDLLMKNQRESIECKENLFWWHMNGDPCIENVFSWPTFWCDCFLIHKIYRIQTSKSS